MYACKCLYVIVQEMGAANTNWRFDERLIREPLLAVDGCNDGGDGGSSSSVSSSASAQVIRSRTNE